MKRALAFVLAMLMLVCCMVTSCNEQPPVEEPTQTPNSLTRLIPSPSPSLNRSPNLSLSAPISVF